MWGRKWCTLRKIHTTNIYLTHSNVWLPWAGIHALLGANCRQVWAAGFLTKHLKTYLLVRKPSKNKVIKIYTVLKLALEKCPISCASLTYLVPYTRCFPNPAVCQNHLRKWWKYRFQSHAPRNWLSRPGIRPGICGLKCCPQNDCLLPGLGAFCILWWPGTSATLWCFHCHLFWY